MYRKKGNAIKALHEPKPLLEASVNLNELQLIDKDVKVIDNKCEFDFFEIINWAFSDINIKEKDLQYVSLY